MKSTKRFRKTEPPKTAVRTAGIQVRTYETKLDAKKRIVLRGAQHKYYEVSEKANGSILLTPKKLVDVEPISVRSMEMLESSIANFKKGIVSEVIDLSDLRRKFAAPKTKLRMKPTTGLNNRNRFAAKQSEG